MHVSQNARHIGDSLHSNGLALLRENQDAPLEQFTDLSDIDHQQQVAWSRLITTFDETLSVVRPALGLVPEIGANLETGVNILKKIFAASHRIGDLHAHAMEAVSSPMIIQ